MDTEVVIKRFMSKYRIDIVGESTGLAIWYTNNNEEVFRIRYTTDEDTLVIYRISLTPIAKGKRITVKLVRYLKGLNIDFRIEDVDNNGLYSVCLKQGLKLVPPTIGTSNEFVLGSDKECYGTFEYKKRGG